MANGIRQQTRARGVKGEAKRDDLSQRSEVKGSKSQIESIQVKIVDRRNEDGAAAVPEGSLQLSIKNGMSKNKDQNPSSREAEMDAFEPG